MTKLSIGYKDFDSHSSLANSVLFTLSNESIVYFGSSSNAVVGITYEEFFFTDAAPLLGVKDLVTRNYNSAETSKLDIIRAKEIPPVSCGLRCAGGGSQLCSILD